MLTMYFSQYLLQEIYISIARDTSALKTSVFIINLYNASIALPVTV